MKRFVLRHLLLPDGWKQDVRLAVTADGVIGSTRGGPATQTDSADDSIPVNGWVVPGMPNAHSHAFQRDRLRRMEDLREWIRAYCQTGTTLLSMTYEFTLYSVNR